MDPTEYLKTKKHMFHVCATLGFWPHFFAHILVNFSYELDMTIFLKKSMILSFLWGFGVLGLLYSYPLHTKSTHVWANCKIYLKFFVMSKGSLSLKQLDLSSISPLCSSLLSIFCSNLYWYMLLYQIMVKPPRGTTSLRFPEEAVTNLPIYRYVMMCYCYNITHYEYSVWLCLSVCLTVFTMVWYTIIYLLTDTPLILSF